jgi:N-acyl-L-homoserine lactone synthetase
VADHLARAVAGWAQRHGRTDWYTVCEARHLRALRWRGLRFTQLGRAVEYQPGVEACAAVLRLPVASAELRAHRAHDYAWYAGGGRP